MARLNPEELARISDKLRLLSVKMLITSGLGHAAGALSLADIVASLYFNMMNHDPKKPDWSERDRLILSNGHVCTVLYAALSEAGYFPPVWLLKFGKLDCPLQVHPERLRVPGIETTSGSLGMGLGQAVGIALGAKMDDARFRVYCIASDGEHDEGNHWEAVLAAAKYKLSNLTLFVDRNNIQIDGITEEVLPLGDLTRKYQDFGWNTFQIDGNNHSQILEAGQRARAYYWGPTAIIARTLAGKGVSFMEGKVEWHGKTFSKEEGERAIAELEKHAKRKT